MRQHTHETITERVLEIIAETSETDLAEIRATMQDQGLPFQDAGVDSLDFLDIVFSLEKEFGIRKRALDYDRWLQRMEENSETHDGYGHPYYTLGSIVAHIEDQLDLPVVKGEGEPFQRRKYVPTPRPRKKTAKPKSKVHT